MREMNLIELYGYAEQRGITVVNWKIDNKRACAIKMKREYHILMNDRLISGEREERIVLAHELGHCRSDRMYYLQDFCNPLYRQNIAKAERKGRTRTEVNTVIYWLTGYDEKGIEAQLQKDVDSQTFFCERPFHPSKQRKNQGNDLRRSRRNDQRPYDAADSVFGQADRRGG